MIVSGRPITLLLIRLWGSVTSLSTCTPAPPLSSQISPPSPSPSNLPPSLTVPPSRPALVAASTTTGESAERARCPMRMSPSAVVVRFDDPVTANCSVPEKGFSLLGWSVSLAAPEATMDRFLVWRVDRMTDWSIEPMCYVLSDQGGQCHMHLPVIVYKPPDHVAISLQSHAGPMFEGHPYTLQCEVRDVAPVRRLTVTFYKGQTSLCQLRSDDAERTPVNKSFAVDIIPAKEDDGVQYWCEAKLDLGPEGPRPPPAATSQKLNATVLFGPHLICPTKLQVREGESLACEVRGNPRPSVTWFRDGQVVALPANSSRRHAGKYTVWTKGHLGQKNFTVEVEVLADSGRSASSALL
uniref:Ig-like domain-containing protein n=1 Tax=Scophthalmus maximus TaxID=52904 RepID=A0A8D3BIF5_SCOMX